MSPRLVGEPRLSVCRARRGSHRFSNEHDRRYPRRRTTRESAVRHYLYFALHPPPSLQGTVDEGQRATKTGEVFRMHQITRVHMVASSTGGYHEHIGAVELSTGQRLSREAVITEIRRGVVFYTMVNGQQARVYAPNCHRCRAPYITTSPDGTTANNLDNLPKF